MNQLFNTLSKTESTSLDTADLRVILQDVISICLETNPWLKSTEWCNLHGYSRAQFEKWIENGILSEYNGALKKGTGQTGKHKRIHRFFNPYIRRVDYGMDSE